MENARTTTIARETNANTNTSTISNIDPTQKRLDLILAANAVYARRGEMYRDDKEQFEAESMTKPISSEKAFSNFGLMLGAIPPATIFGKFIYQSNTSNGFIAIAIFLTVVTAISATTGYFTGKSVGKLVKSLEKRSWGEMLFAVPFIGIFWGLISGASGGFLIFLVGAIFGGIIGGMVGGVALPAFTILHRIFKRGELIESKHFYPIAFGVTMVISAIILGL